MERLGTRLHDTRDRSNGREDRLTCVVGWLVAAEITCVQDDLEWSQVHLGGGGGGGGGGQEMNSSQRIYGSPSSNRKKLLLPLGLGEQR